MEGGRERERENERAEERSEGKGEEGRKGASVQEGEKGEEQELASDRVRARTGGCVYACA